MLLLVRFRWVISACDTADAVPAAVAAVVAAAAIANHNLVQGMSAPTPTIRHAGCAVMKA